MVDLFCDLLFGGEFTSYKAYHGLVQMRGKTKITTVVRPERLFGEILELFRMNEYREVYILIDEFEDIHMKLSKAKLTQYLSEFRSLIDNNIKYCAFAIAMVPSAWETLEEVQPAFAERFSRRVDLLPLSDEQVQAVLTGYLRRAMSSVDVDVVSEVEATLVFDVEAISEINRVQGGNIRAIVELCHRLIEHGVSRGVKPITAGFVQMIARSTGD